MSIGPQIPEHLLRQLQSPSNLLDVSDDEGPQPAVPSSTSTSIAAGVTHAQKPVSVQQQLAGDEDQDEEDAFAPALPPDLVRPSKPASADQAGPSTHPKHSVGPSLPGPRPFSSQHPTTSADAGDESDSDSDDGYGPMPAPASAEPNDGLSEGVREFIEREERRKKEVEEAAKPKKAVRDEWMLVPPSSNDIMGHLSDPTKLKARQFSRSAAPSSRGQPNNLWTETPAERAQRVADEVAGRKRRAVDVGDAAGVGEDEDAGRKRRRDEELRRVVDEHNKSSRAQSLISMHGTSKSSQSASSSGDKEGPPGVWDHARDMAVGGRLMDDKQRGKLIADARALGDRFGSGKGGGYL